MTEPHPGLIPSSTLPALSSGLRVLPEGDCHAAASDSEFDFLVEEISAVWLPKEDEITKAERMCWWESFSRPLSHADCLGKVSRSGHPARQKCGPTRTRPGNRDLLDIIRRRESQGSATPVFCSLKEILKKSIKIFIFNKVI